MASRAPRLPRFAARVVRLGLPLPTDRAAIDVTVRLASASARNGGGPFGALVRDALGRVVGVGWNAVVTSHDSTAHAEVMAIRMAQKRLGTHDLGSAPGAPTTLYASCEPCIQCFGAVYWSGLSRVVSAARSKDAEAHGFAEGPVGPALWRAAGRDKGVVHEGGVRGRLDPMAPLRLYKRLGGPVY